MADQAPQVDWAKEAEMDPTVDMMLSSGAPMTRERYILAKYGRPGSADYPEQWTDEHEDSLPGPFQRE
jgi:hypothetical protein